MEKNRKEKEKERKEKKVIICSLFDIVSIHPSRTEWGGTNKPE